MANVLVCIKRVPETSGEILLTDDAMGIDARHVGYTLSAHDECAVELATQIAKATDGEATVLSLGSEDSVEQIRDALAVGCTAAIHIEADGTTYGPSDVAAAIAEVVRGREAEGTTYDLVLVGNDAADTGDFQVGVRLAYALGRPVLTGDQHRRGLGRRPARSPRARGLSGTEVFELPLPAVIAVSEGGVEPRYPTIPGRMKAKRTTIDAIASPVQAAGTGRVRLELPPAQPSVVEILGTGPEAAPAVVDLLYRLGVVAK